MKEIVLDLGCGDNKVHQQALGIDKYVVPGVVNVLCDLERGIGIRSNVADRVYTRHTLEHVADLERALSEILRVVKPGGLIEIIVPHYSNPLGYSDYTHKRFFGLYTFDYFCVDKSRYWAVPTYHPGIRVKIVRKRLIFKNFSVLSGPMEWLFNSSEWFSYLYESKMSWFLPCFEIRFQLKKP